MEVFARLVNGKAEVLLPDGAGELERHMAKLKADYRERRATGKYGPAKERSDLKTAFIDFAMGLGYKRGEAQRAFGRMW